MLDFQGNVLCLRPSSYLVASPRLVFCSPRPAASYRYARSRENVISSHPEICVTTRYIAFLFRTPSPGSNVVGASSRRRMGQFPAFVLVSCLRIMDKNDEDQARAAQLFDLRFRAGLLQVHTQAGQAAQNSIDVCVPRRQSYLS